MCQLDHAISRLHLQPETKKRISSTQAAFTLPSFQLWLACPPRSARGSANLERLRHTVTQPSSPVPTPPTGLRDVGHPRHLARHGLAPQHAQRGADVALAPRHHALVQEARQRVAACAQGSGAGGTGGREWSGAGLDSGNAKKLMLVKHGKSKKPGHTRQKAGRAQLAGRSAGRQKGVWRGCAWWNRQLHGLGKLRGRPPVVSLAVTTSKQRTVMQFSPCWSTSLRRAAPGAAGGELDRCPGQRQEGRVPRPLPAEPRAADSAGNGGSQRLALCNPDGNTRHAMPACKLASHFLTCAARGRPWQRALPPQRARRRRGSPPAPPPHRRACARGRQTACLQPPVV